MKKAKRKKLRPDVLRTRKRKPTAPSFLLNVGLAATGAFGLLIAMLAH
jgi:hypothetical protein